MQGVVELPRHVRGGHTGGRGREVGPSDVADEERIAREDEARLGVEDEDRDALGRVARRLEDAQEDPPKADLLSVAHGVVREAGPGLLAEDDRRARLLRELPVTAHEVRVQVGLENPADREALRPRLGQVLVHVAAGVDDRGLAAVADQVGRVGETTQVELPEEHRSSRIDDARGLRRRGRCLHPWRA